jgi:hypothetical protein
VPLFDATRAEACMGKGKPPLLVGHRDGARGKLRCKARLE